MKWDILIRFCQQKKILAFRDLNFFHLLLYHQQLQLLFKIQMMAGDSLLCHTLNSRVLEISTYLLIDIHTKLQVFKKSCDSYFLVLLSTKNFWKYFLSSLILFPCFLKTFPSKLFVK